METEPEPLSRWTWKTRFNAEPHYLRHVRVVAVRHNIGVDRRSEVLFQLACYDGPYWRPVAYPLKLWSENFTPEWT